MRRWWLCGVRLVLFVNILTSSRRLLLVNRLTNMCIYIGLVPVLFVLRLVTLTAELLLFIINPRELLLNTHF